MYTYDNNGNQLTITDSTGTITRVYDDYNRVTSKTVSGIGTSYYEYDNVYYDVVFDWYIGKLIEISTDPKGNEVIKLYDKEGRVTMTLLALN